MTIFRELSELVKGEFKMNTTSTAVISSSQSSDTGNKGSFWERFVNFFVLDNRLLCACVISADEGYYFPSKQNMVISSK